MPEEPEVRSRISYYVADSQGAVYPIVRSVSGMKTQRRRGILKKRFPRRLCGLPEEVTSDNLGMVINNLCRMLFPSAFLLFNLVYWVSIAN